VGQAIVKVVAVHRRSGPLTQPGLSDGRIEDRIRRFRKDKNDRNGEDGSGCVWWGGTQRAAGSGLVRVRRADEDDKRRWNDDRVKVNDRKAARRKNFDGSREVESDWSAGQ